MAVWVRSGGFGVCRRFPNVAGKKVGKKAKERAVCCSLHGEADTQQQMNRHSGIMCDLCNGCGWLICDFCRGQKTNVKSESSRFYRRCPYCKAVGLVLCPKCKVFKCVTFPDFSDKRA